MGVFLGAALLLIVVKQWQLAATDHSAPIDNFAAALEQHGLTGQAPLQTKGGVKIPHETTFEVTVAGKPVWLVYFDPFDPAQYKARAEVKRSGKIEFDGQPLDAKVRGAVALVGFQGHPEEQRLLAAFIDFQTP
jgi:hypothetical protein